MREAKERQMREAKERKIRERMVELVTAALCNQSAEEVAEYLLAHGVVFVRDDIPLAEETLLGVWIPTSRAMPHYYPDPRRRVLVTIEDENGKRFTSTAKYDEQYKEWHSFTDYRFSDTRYFKIVAWMDKPAPWKAVDYDGYS